MNYIEYYNNKKLLADGKTNTKMAKNKMKTYGLSLIPHSLNSKGENLCKGSTKECRAMCLNMSGRAGFNSVQQARVNKTDFFVYQKPLFVNKLYKELEHLDKKAKETILIRLNVVSDVDWEAEMKKENKSLGDFKNLLFYAYTKVPYHILGNTLNNQHFTFSYSGGNWQWCEKFLKEKTANVAIVFKNTIPLSYKGFKVINGDLSDERVLDEKGVIVGLKYKVPKGIHYLKNKFVIDD
jgi:hypothetical protein